jgi:hypothetical protein
MMSRVSVESEFVVYKVWVREQSRRFLEQYFRESLGSRHPALTILRRLSAQVPILVVFREVCNDH